MNVKIYRIIDERKAALVTISLLCRIVTGILLEKFISSLQNLSNVRPVRPFVGGIQTSRVSLQVVLRSEGTFKDSAAYVVSVQLSAQGGKFKQGSAFHPSFLHVSSASQVSCCRPGIKQIFGVWLATFANRSAGARLSYFLFPLTSGKVVVSREKSSGWPCILCSDLQYGLTSSCLNLKSSSNHQYCKFIKNKCHFNALVNNVFFY